MFLRINILLDYEIVLFYIKITNRLIFNMARSKKHFNFCYILTGTPYAIFNKKKWIIKTLLPIKYLYVGLTQSFDHIFAASCTIRFVCYIILRRNNLCRLYKYYISIVGNYHVKNQIFLNIFQPFFKHLL